MTFARASKTKNDYHHYYQSYIKLKKSFIKTTNLWNTWILRAQYILRI